MAREKLTDLKVKAQTKPGRYGDGGGLWLQVRDADHKSWLFRYTHGGKQRQLGLGPYPLIGLREARQSALDAARTVFAGGDPIADKRAKKTAAAAERQAAISFKEVAEMYLAAHEGTWRNPKHRWQWRATLEAHAFPVFGDLPIQNVDTGAVMRVIEPIWLRLPETAARLRGRIETVLDYATARGWRHGDNPARWRGHVASLLPARGKVSKVTHHAALSYIEIGQFWSDLSKRSGNAASALRFTILTAARTSEVIGAHWSEIDLKGAVWNVPGERMKAGKPHRVPLTPAAMQILEDLSGDKEPNSLIFAGQKRGSGLSNMAMTALLRRMSRGDLTVHGFRSTFRDWAAERTTVAREVAEAALAHTLKDKTEAAYQRSDLFDKRRRLMEAWATFCETSTVEAEAKVVAIRAPS